MLNNCGFISYILNCMSFYCWIFMGLYPFCALSFHWVGRLTDLYPIISYFPVQQCLLGIGLQGFAIMFSCIRCHQSHSRCFQYWGRDCSTCSGPRLVADLHEYIVADMFLKHSILCLKSIVVMFPNTFAPFSGSTALNLKVPYCLKSGYPLCEAATQC